MAKDQNEDVFCISAADTLAPVVTFRPGRPEVQKIIQAIKEAPQGSTVALSQMLPGGTSAGKSYEILSDSDRLCALTYFAELCTMKYLLEAVSGVAYKGHCNITKESKLDMG